MTMLMNYTAMSHIFKNIEDATLDALLDAAEEFSDTDIHAKGVEAAVDDWITSDIMEVVCGSG